MKKKSAKSELVDDYLHSVEGMKEAETGSFFYSRLIAKMEVNKLQQEWRFPLKPVWMVTALSMLLVINGFIVSQQYKINGEPVAATSSLQSFATAYNLSIPSTY